MQTIEVIEIKKERFWMKCPQCGQKSDYNPQSPRGRLTCLECLIPMDYE